MAAVTTRAVLLRSFPYGDTSRVLRFLTEDHGVVGVMAKGVRRVGGRGGGAPDTFAAGDLMFYMKDGRDLHTMKEFTTTRPRRRLGLGLLRLGAASVLAEIVLRHGGDDAGRSVFATLEQGLDRLEEAQEETLLQVLLARGWSLVDCLGYRPVLHACVACGRPLEEDEMGHFDFQEGGVRCAACAGSAGGPRIGPGARAQVEGLLAGREDPVSLPRAHLRLLHDFVIWHLSGTRPLESFRILADLVPPDPEGP